MHSPHVPKLLLAAAVLTASAVATYACGNLPMKTPGRIDRAVVRDGRLVAISSTGHLVSVELLARRVKDLGTFDMKLSPCVDFAGNKACVASQNRLYQVDLTTGKIVRAVICDQVIQGLGLISSERVYVQNGATIAIVDLAAGKTVQTVDLGKEVCCTAADLPAKRIYALTTGIKGGGLITLDLDKGQISDRLEIPELRTPMFRPGAAMHLAGDRVYVICPRYSYGIWIGRFGSIDLKLRKYHDLKPPIKLQASFKDDHSGRHGQLLPGHACFAPPTTIIRAPIPLIPIPAKPSAGGTRPTKKCSSAFSPVKLSENGDRTPKIKSPVPKKGSDPLNARGLTPFSGLSPFSDNFCVVRKPSREQRRLP
jgi:hypothetical protein